MKNTKKQSSKPKITVAMLNKQSREIGKVKEKVKKLNDQIVVMQNKLYADACDMYDAKYVNKWLMINGTIEHESNDPEPKFDTYKLVLCKYIHPTYDHITVGIQRGFEISPDDGYMSIGCLTDGDYTNVIREDNIKVLSDSEALSKLNEIDIKLSNFIGESIQSIKPVVDIARKKRR